MVCEWGMSEEMGPLTFGKKEEQIFLGREIAQHQDYSEDTAVQIDQEVKKIVLDGYARAKVLLENHREALTRLAEALLEYESLDLVAIERVVKGERLDVDVQTPEDGGPRREPQKEEEKKKIPPLVKRPAQHGKAAAGQRPAKNDGVSVLSHCAAMSGSA
jgi:cell division protease FtsH